MSPILNKLEMSGIKKLTRDDAWDFLIKALGFYVDRINALKPSGADAFETLRSLHTNQGKVDGVKEFFEEIERLNFKQE